MTWEDGIREARKFLPYAEERFPQFVEEIRGIAEVFDSTARDGCSRRNWVM